MFAIIDIEITGPTYKYGKVCTAPGIKIKGRHRAGGDAFATVRLFGILLTKNLHSPNPKPANQYKLF